MTPEVIAAFISGVGAILGAGYSLKRARREEREACEKRIAELDKAYHLGLKEGLHMSKRRSA